MKKNKNENSELFNVYAEYEEIITKENFINFTQLITSILFKNNLGFQSQTYLDFLKYLNEGLDKRYDIVYDNFIINFNVNPKFDIEKLVPMLSNFESSNNDAINLKNSITDESLNKFLNDLNIEISRVLNSHCFVEIIPNVIIYLSENTGQLKLLFNKEIIKTVVR